jgi:hypothetical protein
MNDTGDDVNIDIVSGEGEAAISNYFNQEIAIADVNKFGLIAGV